MQIFKDYTTNLVRWAAEVTRPETLEKATFKAIKNSLADPNIKIDTFNGLPSFDFEDIEHIPVGSLECYSGSFYLPTQKSLTSAIAPWCKAAEGNWIKSKNIIFRNSKVFDISEKRFLDGEFINCFKDEGMKTSMIFRIENNEPKLLSFGSAMAIFQYRVIRNSQQVFQTGLHNIDPRLWLPGIVYRSRIPNPDHLRINSHLWDPFVESLSVKALNYYNLKSQKES